VLTHPKAADGSRTAAVHRVLMERVSALERRRLKLPSKLVLMQAVVYAHKLSFLQIVQKVSYFSGVFRLVELLLLQFVLILLSMLISLGTGCGYDSRFNWSSSPYSSSASASIQQSTGNNKKKKKKDKDKLPWL